MQYYQPVSNMQPMRVYAQQQPIQQQQQTMVQPKRGTALLTGPPQTVGNVQPMNGITQQHYNQIQQQQSHSGVSMTHLMTNKSEGVQWAVSAHALSHDAGILARNMTGIRPPPPSYSSSVHQAPVKTVFRPAVSLNAAPQFMNTTRGVQQVQIVHHHPGQQPQVYAQNMVWRQMHEYSMSTRAHVAATSALSTKCTDDTATTTLCHRTISTTTSIAQSAGVQCAATTAHATTRSTDGAATELYATARAPHACMCVTDHAVTPVRMPPPPRPPQR
jgi:hypothetical protein